MWQSQRFTSQQQEVVLAEALEWLTEHEELIVEFSTAVACEPDGTHICVVKYRARGLRPMLFPSNEV